MAGWARLDWLPIDGVTSYRIHWGPTSHPTSGYPFNVTTTNLTVTISNLTFGTWYFTGVALSGNMVSDPAPELSWTNRPPAPAFRLTTSTNGGTVLLRLPMDGNIAAQAAVSPAGPWSNWFAGQRLGLPDVTSIELQLDAADPHRFFRLTP